MTTGSLNFPLSVQQKGILAEIELSDRKNLFHIAKVLEIKGGSLDSLKLRQAFYKILERHPILTVRFDEKTFEQFINSPHSESFRSFEIDDRNLMDFLNEYVRRPFDLSQGPLFIFSHIRTDSDREFILILAHHLIVDLWSIGIFLEELFAFLNGESLEAVPRSYDEFVSFQQEQLSASTISEKLDYWQKVGEPFFDQAYRIPFDCEEHAIFNIGERIHPFDLSEATSEGLLRCSKANRIQLVSILLTIYSSLFFLRTGHTTFCIGTTSNGRQQLKWSKTIGLFSNPVPLMISIDPVLSFIDSAKTIQKQLATHLRRYQLPIGFLVEKLRKRGAMHDVALFQHMFVYQQVPSVLGELKKLSLPTRVLDVLWKKHHLATLDWNHPFSPYDLTFYLHEIEGRVSGFIEYAQHKYSKQMIDSLVEEFQSLSHFFARNSQQGIGQYETGSSQRSALRSFNQETLNSRLAKWARIKRNKVVLYSGTKALSYGQLDKLSCQVARMFMDRGVIPGDFVGIQMNHSLETYIAMIAVWKCGGAFIPIDIQVPPGRVNELMKDSGAKLLIRDLDLSIARQFSSSPITTFQQPGLPAYLIYTSGSTGKPKGVVVSHQNLDSYLAAIDTAYSFSLKGHAAVFSSLSFDLTLTSLFYPLYAGHSAHLFDRNLELDVLFKEIFRHPLITYLKCTPSHLKCFQELNLEESGIELFIIGGEQLSRSVATAISEKLTHPVGMINEYGPTEGTIGCIFQVFDPGEANDRVPIGRPLKNTTAFLLSPFYHLLSANCEGALHLGGEGVAMGYWKDPKKTAAVFLPNPFERGKRMYCTGDIALLNRSGQLEFLGRKDGQVKIRGYRIEPNEIQETLQALPYIKDAFVKGNIHPVSGDTVLTAYCVCRKKVMTQGIESDLRKALPSYMIPTFFIECDSIPLTINGKVDVQKLPDLIERDHVPDALDVGNETEYALRDIWSSILDQASDCIGFEESFFFLGGDSIKAIQAVALGKKRGLNFSIRDIMEKKTIRNLARKIAEEHVIIEENDIESFPLHPIQRWFFSRFRGNFNHFNQGVILKDLAPIFYTSEGKSEETNRSLYIGNKRFAKDDITNCPDCSRKCEKWEPGSFNLIKMKEVLYGIIESQPFLRAHFPDRQNAHIQKSPNENCSFTVSEKSLSQWEFEEQIQNLQKKMDIASGPLMQVGIFSVDGDQRVVILIHHLIVDGISWHLLLHALNEALCMDSRQQLDQLKHPLRGYIDRFSENSTPSLPEDIDADFAVSEQRRVSVKVSLKALTQLEKYDQSLVEETLFAVFLAAYFATTNETTCSTQVERHGRQLPNVPFDFSSMIGWFTQLQSTEISKRPNLTLLDLFRHARDGLKRGLNFDASPEILFNYLGEFKNNHYSSFAFEPIWTGLVDPNGHVPYALQVNFISNGEEIQGEFLFDSIRYSKNTQNAMVEAFSQSFKSLCEELTRTGTIPKIPDDFGTSMSLDELDRLIDQIQKSHRVEINSIEKILPILPSQKGIFLHSISRDQGTSYFQQLKIALKGRIDFEQIKGAFEACLQAFPSLRTRFLYKGLQEPHRLVQNTAKLEIHHVEDLSKYLEEDSLKGFDLDQLPLIRLGYYVEGESEFSLIFSYHHIVMDGWSLTLFFNRFLEEIKNPASKVVSLHPIDLSDMGSKESDREYWQKLLHGISQTSLIPKKERQSAKTLGYHEEKISFGKEVTKCLSACSKQFDVSIANLLHGIWAYLLSLYSDSDRVVFGTVVSGRSEQSDALEHQVDQLSMVIPVSVPIDRALTLIDISTQLQEQIRKSETHLILSTNEIEMLTPFRSQLFDHIIVIENYPFSGEADQLIRTKELSFQFKSAELRENSHYPFAISFFPGECLRMELQFDQSLIPSWFVESVIRDFQVIFDSFEKISTTSLRNVSLYQPGCPTVIKNRQRRSIPDQFKSQLRNSKNRIALVDGNRQLSYAMLDKLSDSVALALLKKGLQLEENVGIMIHRSLEWVITWLGILKAGGVYIPLHPNNPSERTAAIVNEAKLRFMVKHTPSMFPMTDTMIETLSFDELMQWCSATRPVFPSIDPEQLAYTLFTSGTTGTPKGIAMPHAPVMNHLDWIIEQYKLKSSDRMLQLTSYTFDVSVCELYALLVGGTLVLAPETAEQNLSLLLKTIEENQITFVQMVPSLLDALLVPETAKSFATVRQVLCGADVMHPHQLEKWNQQVAIPLSNLYGLTETCIDSTHFDCSVMTHFNRGIPIGKPITNINCYHLDTFYNGLPFHSKGFLFIGGCGLARGYLGRSDLTAEGFLPDPFSVGRRMYATRDRITIDENGDLRFAGRVDNQVKLRGLRVELDEIRQLVSQFEGIEEVYLTIVGEKSGEVLCCYYKGSKKIELTDLKEFLRRSLPSYMIPNLFVQLDQFPLTPHGKIDTKSLLMPEQHVRKSSTSAKEKEIAKYFAEVLDLDPEAIDPNINFFDLGGSSMTLMKLHYKMNQAAGQEIPITAFFEHSTVRQLSAYFSNQTKQSSDDDQHRKRTEMRKGRKKKVPLSPMKTGKDTS